MKKNYEFREMSTTFLPIVPILAATLASVMLTGCGSSSYDTFDAVRSSEMVESASMDGIYNSASGDVYSYEYEDAVAMDSNADVTVQDTSRKLIRNVDMDVETEEFDELVANVQSRINSLGGYVESSNVYNGNRYDYYAGSTGNLRNASMTIRIPASSLNEFLSLMSEQSNVTRKSESVEDVTLEYVDMDSHKKTLQAEQDRLMELMDQAESIEDLITIESRLSDIRYQIESMESQLRTFDNQVTYSTVYLYIEEVKVYTQIEELSRFEEMTQGFSDSVDNVINGLLDFGVGFVISIPYLFVGFAFLCIVILVVFLIHRRSVKKLEKKLKSVQSPVSEKQE